MSSSEDDLSDEEWDVQEEQAPAPAPTGGPPVGLSQPRTASQMESVNREWNEYFQNHQQAVIQQAVAFNTLPYHQQPLPPGLMPIPAPAPPVGQIFVQEMENPPPKKKSKRNEELPPELAGFRYEHKANLICEDEVNLKNKSDPGPYKVARYVVVRKGKPNEKKFDLKELSSAQIRKLAINFGCKGSGGLTMFDCRRQMALCKDTGILYRANDIPNPTSSTQEKKLNTIMRILNAAFSPRMVDRLIQLNDRKSRKDYEAANGGSPTKEFFKDLSDQVNDSLNNEDLQVVLDSDEDEDIHLYDLVSNNLVNLNDFTQQTYQSCQQHLVDVLKVRERCCQLMSVSGEHSNDLWTYCTNKKNTRVRKDVYIPAAAVYYCHVLCSKYPAIDGTFCESLKDDLKSDSAAVPTGSAGSYCGSKTSSSSASKSTLISSFEQCLTQAGTGFSRSGFCTAADVD